MEASEPNIGEDTDVDKNLTAEIGEQSYQGDLEDRAKDPRDLDSTGHGHCE
jgi:hypothetical protein